MRKLTALIVVALAMLTASMALGETLVMTQIEPAIGRDAIFGAYLLNKGQQYTFPVLLKNGQTRYYSGTFIGWMLVHDIKHPPFWRGYKQVSNQQKVAVVDKSTAKQIGSYSIFLAFKGAHSTLLYTDKSRWVIVEA